MGAPWRKSPPRFHAISLSKLSDSDLRRLCKRPNQAKSRPPLSLPHPQQTGAEHLPDIFTGRAQSSGETLGRLRIIYRRDDHRILGLHVLAEGAVDLMGEAALAVRNGLTLEQIAASIHPHPHLTEAFRLTAPSALAQPPQG
ncbi:hypothetical protein AB4874_09285 [Thioclava sp. 15-R06ZXC-3]|uniref:Pyridine nucleotide-disulphide oxidoreductase dimerisation domain-containing protein n=1 Tax=Thioclava arctica TaxID=3238301 RepID=A0ABV3TKJ4_9RHOB